MKHDIDGEQQENIIDNRGGIFGGSRNTINFGFPTWAVILIVLIFIIGIFLVINQLRNESSNSLAYHFLVDVSENMNQTINGITLYDIAKQAIQTIRSSEALYLDKAWLGLRLAGGEDCNQTSLIDSGVGISTDSFINQLNLVSPTGINSYEKGMNAALGDMLDIEAETKVIFIMLGSLDNEPCGAYALPTILSNYKVIGKIAPIICTFAIVENELAFEDFKRQMIVEGFDCVYQADNPEDISRVVINIIHEHTQKQFQHELTLLPPILSVDLIGIPPITFPTETTIAEALPNITDTPVPTETYLPTLTNTPTDDPTSSEAMQLTEQVWLSITETLNAQIAMIYANETQSYIEQSSFSPTPTNTNPPIVPTYTDSPTATYTAIPVPSETLTPTPSLTIEYISEDVTITVNVPSANGANLRTGPGTNYSRAGFAPNDSVFPVIARTEDNEWYLIDDDNRHVWIWRDIVEITDNIIIPIVMTIPPTPVGLTACLSDSGFSVGMNARIDMPDGMKLRVINNVVSDIWSDVSLEPNTIVHLKEGPFCNRTGRAIGPWWLITVDPNHPDNQGRVNRPGHTGNIWTSQSPVTTIITGYISDHLK